MEHEAFWLKHCRYLWRLEIGAVYAGRLEFGGDSSFSPTLFQERNPFPSLEVHVKLALQSVYFLQCRETRLMTS